MNVVPLLMCLPAGGETARSRGLKSGVYVYIYVMIVYMSPALHIFKVHGK